MTIDRTPPPQRPPARRGHVAPALEVDHVSAAYGPYRALFDITFSVPAGGITALLGSNGAGKSTVARVVSGLMPSTEGSIRIGGTDVTGTPPTGSPGRAWPTCPRAGASSPTSPSRRTSSWPSASGWDEDDARGAGPGLRGLPDTG